LAILALFPIGAVSMARAINQNRAADHASNSDAVLRYYWKNAWIDRQYGGGVRNSTLEAYAASGEEMLVLLERRPGYNLANSPDILATSQQPSFVVVVDPIGYQTQQSFGPANRLNIGGQPTLPARSTLFAAEADVAKPYRTRARLTTLLDDMSWDKNGEPANLTGQLERGGRYNVAWVIQRPRNSTPHEVKVTVLVYAGRSPTDTPSSETTFAAHTLNYDPNAEPKPNTINVPLGGQSTPNVRKGGWVGFSLNCWPHPHPPQVPAGVQYPTLDFYRVSAVTEDPGNGGQIILEFEQPLRSYDVTTLTGYQGPANGHRLDGTVIFFDNLVEVFDRGTMSAQAITGR
jgi:hypothetical protein